jgi:hypothetical protein
MPEVSRGWKVFVLAWAWIGIALGLTSESALVTFIVWSVGASVGWLIAAPVRDFGWTHASTQVLWRVAPPAVGCVALLALVAGIVGQNENRNALLLCAIVAGLAALMLWKRDWLEGRWLMIPAAVSAFVRENGPLSALNATDRNAVVGVLLTVGVVGVGLLVVLNLPWSGRGGLEESPPKLDDTRYRCPECDKPTAFRCPDGLLRCDACGHTFSSYRSTQSTPTTAS